MYFIDTNIFLRFLTRDHKEKAERCKELLEKAQKGEIKIFTSELVVAELVWVLQSPKTYNLKPAEIRNLLLPILTLKNLVFPHKNLYPTILELFAEKEVDFIDAYNAVLMFHKNIKNIYSYDPHYNQITGICRLEP